MSLDATNWAWRVDVDSSMQRLILLSLADRAGEDHKCYPSLKRLIKDTKMNRKTIIKVLDDLEAKRYIKFTGEIRGNGVKVYQLIGILGRENEPPTCVKNGTSTKITTSTNLGTGSKNGTSTENGTATSTEFGTETSTKYGTQNLPMNLSIESKNKKDWLCLKTLREEIYLADSEVDFVNLIQQRWYTREIQAFQNHNAEKPMSDAVKNYHFADWLLNAKAKYDRRQQTRSTEKPKSEKPSGSGMTDKQINFFAEKLAQHQEFGSKFAEGKESHQQFASRIASKLRDAEYLKKWKRFLSDVGFHQPTGAAVSLMNRCGGV